MVIDTRIENANKSILKEFKSLGNNLKICKIKDENYFISRFCTISMYICVLAIDIKIFTFRSLLFLVDQYLLLPFKLKRKKKKALFCFAFG
jgi:hypothetical protein